MYIILSISIDAILPINQYIICGSLSNGSAINFIKLTIDEKNELTNNPERINVDLLFFCPLEIINVTSIAIIENKIAVS
ncbi:Uncharacterised protein [Chlamydia trachomatis]|nr:Uncharacterised protein [Chlamydia trachomatis]